MENIKNTKKNKKRKRKNGNGLGSVVYLGENRTNCYGVKMTVGWTPEGKQIRKYVGYAKTKIEAEKIRSKFIVNPNDSNFDTITLKDLYEDWLNLQISLQERQQNGEKIKALSKKGLSRYTGIYKNYYSPLYSKVFSKITNEDIQKIVNNCEAGYYTKSDIKGLYSKLKFHSESKKSTDAKFINIGTEVKSTKHKEFTSDEINKLWNNRDVDYAEPLLIQIYSGLRPTELLEIDYINLEEQYMTGGIKTDAGKDRIIPIHNKIIPLVEKWLLSGKLNISYPTYYRHFKETLKELNLDVTHTPHDCRHTTTSILNRRGANEVCVKLILGHEISDITKGTYTHKTNQELIDTINLINI